MVMDSSRRQVLMNRAASILTGVRDDDEARRRFEERLNRIERPDGTLMPVEECPSYRALRGENFVDYPAVFVRQDGAKPNFRM